MGELIVLVRVAARAADREPEPNRAERFHAIHHGGHAPLFFVRAALGVGERLAVEGGGELLRFGGIRQQIAGELFDGKLVKRQIRVDRLNDPIAIAPRVEARAVFFITVAVGIARLVQPMSPPAFAKVRRGQKAIDQFAVSVRRLVVHKIIYFQRCGRQAEQIIIEPLDERRPIGHGGGRHADRF